MKTLKGLDELMKDLDGVPLRAWEPDGPTVPVKNLVANAIAQGSDDDPVGAMALALRIRDADGELELEEAEFVLVEKAIREDKFRNNMGKAAMLKVLEGEK